MTVIRYIMMASLPFRRFIIGWPCVAKCLTSGATHRWYNQCGDGQIGSRTDMAEQSGSNGDISSGGICWNFSSMREINTHKFETDPGQSTRYLEEIWSPVFLPCLLTMWPRLLIFGCRNLHFDIFSFNPAYCSLFKTSHNLSMYYYVIDVDSACSS